MEARLLGGMEAAGEGGAPLAVQGAKQRVLLAMLAVDAGPVVPTDRLIEGLWEDSTPSGVANSLQRLADVDRIESAVIAQVGEGAFAAAWKAIARRRLAALDSELFRLQRARN